MPQLNAGQTRYSPSETGARIKTLRHAVGLTQQEVADRTALSIGFLSQVENGLTSVSLKSLYKISEALGVTATSLLPGETGSPISVVRATDGHWYDLEAGAGTVARDLTTAARDRIETREAILPAGYVSEAWSHAGLEFIHVLSGAMTVELQSHRTEVLHTGDSMLFPAHIPHTWGAGDTDVRLLEIVTHVRGVAPHRTVN